jgi:16S rRNA (guanine966-N2)-methyltransferase
MRVVAGRLRGRALVSPADDAIRPTSDRLRETLFNILSHRFTDKLIGGRVLDLFAGTGALGIEALSRGAAEAVFVDDSPAARGLIRENLEALGLAGQARVLRRDATRLGPAAPNDPFDLVFCDPPYRKGLAASALAAAAAGGWLKPGAIAVVEEADDADFAPPAGFAPIETRRQSVSVLHLLRFGSGEPSAETAAHPAH